MSSFELLYRVKLRLVTTGDSLSEQFSTLEDRLLEIFSMKSSRFSRIHKKEWHGGLVDDKKMRRLNVGDLVLVAHGRVVGSREKWTGFKSIFYCPCQVMRENHPLYVPVSKNGRHISIEIHPYRLVKYELLSLHLN